jgi:hypothetical protein
MFIPNKTYHAIKVVILCTIAALVTIIAGQFVLYMRMADQNETAIQTLDTRLDTLTTVSQLFDKSSLKKHTITESQITDAVTAITALETKVTELEQSVGLLKTSTEILVVNECKVMPYYMDKSLLTTCKNKGF